MVRRTESWELEAEQGLSSVAVGKLSIAPGLPLRLLTHTPVGVMSGAGRIQGKVCLGSDAAVQTRRAGWEGKVLPKLN